ncbi:MAG: Gldg family protein [candidate division KSB1 bacterium]|nr:Gldg family protein [candidate division KSB1 bacterium]
MMKKYFKYTGWAGLVLAIIGLISYSVNSILTTFTTICLIAGGVLLIAYFILNFKEIKTGLTSRSAKFGSNALLVVLFTLGILIVINILASRFSARVDTTASRLYSLAEQTEKVMKNLKRDVNVLGFYKAGESQQAQELLTEYTHFSQRLKTEFLDPDKNPGLAKQYNINRYNTVIVESMGKRERLDELTEENLTNAIIKVTRDKVKTIYFTTGHGERSLQDSEQGGFSKAKQLIQDENYQIDEIMLAAADGEVPSDCSVLAVASPRTGICCRSRWRL